MPTMEEILADPRQKAAYDRLTRIAKQKNVEPLAMLRKPCYLCHTPNNVYEARGYVLNEAGDDPPGFQSVLHCHACGIRLSYFVPLYAMPDPYRWSAPNDLRSDEVLAAAEKMRVTLGR